MSNRLILVRSKTRVLWFSMLAWLLCAAGAAAECVKPEWKDPATFMGQAREARDAHAFAFVNRIHEFIVCQRSSLEKRASGLAPPEVRQLIAGDRAIEERALAEADRIFWCTGAAGTESDPAIVRKKCETYIEWSLDDRRPEDRPSYEELKREQHTAHGGIWSVRTLDFGRPGQCNHAQCDNVLAVEVTNMTPVVLRCDVALTISNPEDGTQRGLQKITLYPGDSFPAAQVSSSRSPENIEPEVTCSAVKPLAPDLSVPASCVLNWLPRSSQYPKIFARSWNSGTALIEFTAGQRHQTVDAIRIVQADPPYLGKAAMGVVEKLSASTNCAGQRFRMRVEYRPFTCYGCFIEPGTVTMTRDDRLLPD